MRRPRRQEQALERHHYDVSRNRRIVHVELNSRLMTDPGADAAEAPSETLEAFASVLDLLG